MPDRRRRAKRARTGRNQGRAGRQRELNPEELLGAFAPCAPGREHRPGPGEVKAHFAQEETKLCAKCLHLAAAEAVLQRVAVALRRSGLLRRVKPGIPGKGIVPFVRAVFFFLAIRCHPPGFRNGIVPFVCRKNFSRDNDVVQDCVPARRTVFTRHSAEVAMPECIAIAGGRARHAGASVARARLKFPALIASDSAKGLRGKFSHRLAQKSRCNLQDFSVFCSALQYFAVFCSRRRFSAVYGQSKNARMNCRSLQKEFAAVSPGSGFWVLNFYSDPKRS